MLVSPKLAGFLKTCLVHGNWGGPRSVTGTVAWVGSLGASLALWYPISAEYISEQEWQRDDTHTDPVTHPNSCQLHSVGETCAGITVGHADCVTLTRTRMCAGTHTALVGCLPMTLPLKALCWIENRPSCVDLVWLLPFTMLTYHVQGCRGIGDSVWAFPIQLGRVIRSD